MLTREEILNETDSQKINVWVSQYVFGRKYPTVEEMKKEAERVWNEQPNCRYFHMGFEAWEEDGEFKWRYTAKDYSSDISAAWEIIKKMRGKGFDVVIESLSDSLNAGGDIYHASFFTRLEGDYADHDSTISFEHAISICALLAVIDS